MGSLRLVHTTAKYSESMPLKGGLAVGSAGSPDFRDALNRFKR